MAECNYKQYDRFQKEYFIDGINDDAATSEIIKELTTIKTRDITSDEVLLLAKEVMAQRLQTAMLENLKRKRGI